MTVPQKRPHPPELDATLAVSGESDCEACGPLHGQSGSAAAPPPRIASAQLFGLHSEVHIEHEGMIYRLRITRRGKLILQK